MFRFKFFSLTLKNFIVHSSISGWVCNFIRIVSVDLKISQGQFKGSLDSAEPKKSWVNIFGTSFLVPGGFQSDPFPLALCSWTGPWGTVILQLNIQVHEIWQDGAGDGSTDCFFACIMRELFQSCGAERPELEDKAQVVELKHLASQCLDASQQKGPDFYPEFGPGVFLCAICRYSGIPHSKKTCSIS